MKSRRCHVTSTSLRLYSKEGIPECMPEEYRCESVVDAYQMYYMVEKMGFARYKFPVDSK